jgi:hypothetical protein
VDTAGYVSVFLKFKIEKESSGYPSWVRNGDTGRHTDDCRRTERISAGEIHFQKFGATHLGKTKIELEVG